MRPNRLARRLSAPIAALASLSLVFSTVVATVSWFAAPANAETVVA
ncbi:MAG: hypothetical protein QOI26_991, partial [Pseudonocardiales bacterium]|nr:hypothetical protein [Pseudonocardiales bacterium]